MILKSTLCLSAMELPRAWKSFKDLTAGLLFHYETKCLKRCCFYGKDLQANSYLYLLDKISPIF